MESTETISPPSFSASARATADLPEAVGPTRKIVGREFTESRLVVRSCAGRLLLAPQEGKENQACCQDPGADQLCWREEAGMDVCRIVISSKVFHERAREGVAHEVRGEDLAVEFPPPKKPRKKDVEQEVEE